MDVGFGGRKGVFRCTVICDMNSAGFSPLSVTVIVCLSCEHGCVSVFSGLVLFLVALFLQVGCLRQSGIVQWLT